MRPVHVTKLMSALPDQHGSLIVQLADGHTAKIPASLRETVMQRSAAESKKLTPNTVLPGNCGTSQVDVGEKENDHPVRMTTGFVVDTPAVEYGWTVDISGPNYSYHYSAAGFLASDSSWSGSHDSEDDYTAGDYSASVTTSSYAALIDGEICSSAGPVADAVLSSPDTPIEHVVPAGTASQASQSRNEGTPSAAAATAPLVPVTDPTQYPNRAVARLDVSWPDLDFGHCSGFFVTTHLVVTAGHCVWDAARGWAQTIFALPGITPDGGHPYGICQVSKMESSEGWVERSDSDYDYAAIVVNCPSGNGTPGVFGLTPPDNQDDAPSSPVTVSGYPGLIDRGLQQHTAIDVPVLSYDERVFTYDVQTLDGMSGSPVYVPCEDGSGTACATGIHAALGVDGTATRITQANLVDYVAWSAAAP
jgi:V8-like Glu-specific endopeptidase